MGADDMVLAWAAVPGHGACVSGRRGRWMGNLASAAGPSSRTRLLVPERRGAAEYEGGSDMVFGARIHARRFTQTAVRDASLFWILGASSLLPVTEVTGVSDSV